MKLGEVKESTKIQMLKDVFFSSRFDDIYDLNEWILSVQKEDPTFDFRTLGAFTPGPPIEQEAVTSVIPPAYGAINQEYQHIISDVLADGQWMSCMNFVPRLKEKLTAKGIQYKQTTSYTNIMEMVRQGRIEKQGSNKGTSYRFIR